ncbi:hypothetical protein ZIOFF_021411 [Zingiber officinale]|uniref:Retrotransposon gag domain-containing protein n=1 Tax=Zingiber officinale TaxID=94328 RepID=A0A8J5H8C1_ZINOF|nr:hypothetical protein ZIOFF_021411 [Zingiber officinale]
MRKRVAALVSFLLILVVPGLISCALSREIEGLKHRHQVEEERMVTKKRVVMEACGFLHGGRSVNGSLVIDEEEEKRVVTTAKHETRMDRLEKTVASTSDKAKVELASINLEGDAIQWYDWLEACHGPPNWGEFKEELLNRFDPSGYENVDGELAKI